MTVNELLNVVEYENINFKTKSGFYRTYTKNETLPESLLELTVVKCEIINCIFNVTVNAPCID